MKTTSDLARSELAQRAEEFRSASQDRDVERMLALFADDAKATMAPGTFRGKAAIRKLFEWEVRLSPVATSKDTGLGMAVVGRSVVWERQVSETAEGVPYTTDAVTILEFNDAGLIQRYRSYYDKLAVMEQISSGLPGIYGWFARALVGYLVALGKKGLDTGAGSAPGAGFDTPAGTRGRRTSRPFGRWLGKRLDRLGGTRIGRKVFRKLMGCDALVLTTIGRRSGTERTTRVGCFPGKDGSWLIVAAAGGTAANPAWYHNIAASPGNVQIEIGGRTVAVTAGQLHGAERAEAWQQITATSPQFARFQHQTDRELPVIRLTPRSGSMAPQE